MTSMVNTGKQLAIGLLLTAVLGLCMTVSFAQLTGSDGIYDDFENEYYHWWNASGRATIGYGTDNSGSWMFGSSQSGGNPEITNDDLIRFIKDAEAYVFSTDTSTELRMGEDGTTVVYVDPDTRVGYVTWRSDDEENPYTIQLKLTLVWDVLKWEYKITNETQHYRRIGFRVLQNVMFPYNETVDDVTPLQQIEAPYYFPVIGAQNKKTELIGGNIPSEWYIKYPSLSGYDSNFQPWWVCKQPLTGEVTRPSRMVIADWDDLQTYGWLEILDAALPENANQPPVITWGSPLGVDSGVGLYYPIMSLGPKEVRTIKGQVKLAWDKQDIVQSFSLSAKAPESLLYREGDNPATSSVIENGYIDPSVFDVKSWVSNAVTSDVTEADVTVAIDLGEGLKLTAGQSRSYRIHLAGLKSHLVRQSEDNNYSWRVEPTGTAGGLLPIRITANFTPGGSTSVTLYVNVPALPQKTLPMYGTAQTLHFIGFPYTFTDPDARVALGQGPNVQLAEYDPSLTGDNKYRFAASDGIDLELGHGYWMRIHSETLLVLQGATPTDQHGNVRVQLHRGWNAISNPFQYAVEWGSCRVYLNGQNYNFIDAVKMGYFSQNLWAWDPQNGQYNPPINPEVLNELTTILEPYRAYWLYVSEPISLIFTPSPTLGTTTRSTSNSRSTTRTKGTADNWMVNIITEAGDAKDVYTAFGFSPEAKTGIASKSIMEPPVAPAGVSAYFPRPDLGRAAGNYAVDLAAPASAKTWKMEVYCAKQNERVTLRWPDLTQLPSKTPLFLVDELTGQRVSMRTSPSYSYNSGTGGARSFSIAFGGAVDRLQFTQANVASGRATSGAAITYGVSIPADVKITLRTQTGSVIRTLNSGRTVGSLTTVQWDGCDAQGRKLPAGLILCELLAEAADGQRIRTILTLRNK